MRNALAQVYRHSRQRLLTVASRYVDQDAEDIVQDAFVRALRHAHEFRSEAAPLTWLYRIVVNACLDHRRNHRRRAALSVLYLNHPGMFLPDAVEAFDVRRILRLLHPTQLRVLVLYEVAGFTHREIAELLSIPEGTSKWRLTAARRRIRHLLTLRDDAPDCSPPASDCPTLTEPRSEFNETC